MKCEKCFCYGRLRPSVLHSWFIQVLAQGDLFLNSSVSEGLPLAIIEASRAGLVVVATDVGGETFLKVALPYTSISYVRVMKMPFTSMVRYIVVTFFPPPLW